MAGAWWWRLETNQFRSVSVCMRVRERVRGADTGIIYTRKAQKFVRERERVNYEISSAPTAKSSERVSSARAGKKAQGSFCLSFVVGCCMHGFWERSFTSAPRNYRCMVGEGVKETCSPRARIYLRASWIAIKNYLLWETIINLPTMSWRVLSLAVSVCESEQRIMCAVRKNTLNI